VDYGLFVLFVRHPATPFWSTTRDYNTGARTM
jgi:hypothetical protein